MDELDRNLIDAWHRITAKCRRDRTEAVKRARRQWSKTFSCPPRAWCVALRAADTRLTEQFGVVAREDEVEMGIEHEVLIDGAAVRRLCAPVSIPWPGVKLKEAAAILGKHCEGLRHWLPVRPGRSKAARAEQAPERWRPIHVPGSPLHVRYECAMPYGHSGVDVPIVWTVGELDPGHVRGRPPHAVWGSMWRSLSKRIPKNYLMNVKRLPRWRPYGDKVRFRGWNWACPGRWAPIESLTAEQREIVDREPATEWEEQRRPMMEQDGRTFALRPCGRRVDVLYAPLPIYGISHFLDGEGIDLSARGGADGEQGALGRERQEEGTGSGLSGEWLPGQNSSFLGLRSFACRHCWRVKGFSLCDYRGWNEFVTYISGGLLFGHEVAMPTGLAFERKVAFKKRAIMENGKQTHSGEVVRALGAL